MKFRSFIWISGIALVLLVLVQYYFITETFETKQKQFDSKYSSLAKLGLFEFENRYYNYQEDSVLTILDDVAYFAIHDERFSDDERSDSLFQQVYDDFNTSLNNIDSKEVFLKKYFSANGEDTSFTTSYSLKNIVLLSFLEEKPIFQDSLENVEYESGTYPLKNYTVERNYYRINFNYVISFNHITDKISREMLLTKILSFGSLLIVFSVFFLSLHNLLKHKRLSELKTDFINNMTHELKTPLSTIAVASSSLGISDGNLSADKIKELSAIIKKQNKHLSRLIDRILDISIWEKDQVRIERKYIKIGSYFEEILSEFKSGHPDAKIRWNIKLSNENLSFPLDEVHMTTVMNNLLSNAYKYGGNPPEINIEIVGENDLIIRVKDNGTGIAEDEQKYIFEKFFRGKQMKEKAIRGLGLGLYYVKQIVEAHKGLIMLDESNKQGSIFSIKLPG